MMYLSQPKQTSKFSKSLNFSSFGRPVRSPRTGSSSLQSYSDTFEESSHNFPSYSESSVSESSAGESSDPEKSQNDTRSVTERLETQVTETIHTDRPGALKTETVYTERPSSITEKIETFISDFGGTEKLYTVTEHLSESEKNILSSESQQYLYTDEFDSTNSHDLTTRSHDIKSSNQESPTLSQYLDTHSPRYSETMATFEEETVDPDTHSPRYSEATATFEEETLDTDTHSPRYSTATLDDEALETSKSSDFPTYDGSYREYSSDFEDKSEVEYSYTFEPTESLTIDDPEKIRQEEESRRIAKKAEDHFISSLISHIKQKPIRDTDISILIDQDLEEEQGKEELDPRFERFLKKKLHLLKKKRKHGDPCPPVNDQNIWEKDQNQYIADYGVHPGLLDKLKLKNFIQSMETAANFEIHNPKDCKECRKHTEIIDSAAAERHFIQVKTRDIRQRVMEDQYHKHLVKMSSINLIAEIARSLPKPTADPEDIMDQLFKGLNLSKSVDNRINH